VEVCIKCQEVPSPRDTNTSTSTTGTEALPQLLLLLLLLAAAANNSLDHKTLQYPITITTTSLPAWEVIEVQQAQMDLSQTDQRCMAVRNWGLPPELLELTACTGEASHPWLWLLLLLVLAT
jgi:hypothetical protein